MRSLEKQTEIPDGSISITEFETIPKGTPRIYYVTYAPYPSETYRILNEPVGGRFVEDAYVYGKMWPAAGIEALRTLLSRFLHLSHDMVESVIQDVLARKSASIPHVRLQPRDLKRLRPA